MRSLKLQLSLKNHHLNGHNWNMAQKQKITIFSTRENNAIYTSDTIIYITDFLKSCYAPAILNIYNQSSTHSRILFISGIQYDQVYSEDDIN